MGCMCAVLMLLVSQGGPGDSPPKAGKSEPAYLAEFRQLKAEMDKLQESINKEYLAAKTEEEREAVARKTLNDKALPLAGKALALVRPHAADKEAVEVFTWVLNYHPASPAASEAVDLLAKHHLTDPQTLETASRFSHAPTPWAENLLRALAQADLPRDRRVRAVLTLAECVKTKVEFPALVKDLDPATLKVVEARFGKEYLADLRAADPAKLENQAIRLFNEAADKYGTEKYGSRTVAEHVKSALFELQHLRIGKPAPDIEGEDIDAAMFKLSDYRGKVVVLDFWGNW
jgi:hypothetical protein